MSIMSVLDSLNITPELLFVAIAAGAALLAGAGVFLMFRSSRGAVAAAPAPKSFPRGTGPKSAPKSAGPKSGPKPAGPKSAPAAGPKSGPRPPRQEHASADAEEAYLREHSMLPYSPENAGGGSDPGAEGSASDPFLEGGFRERRRAPRRKGNPVDVILTDDQEEVEPVAGVVIDRSATGLALELWSEGDIEPGTIISVRPRRNGADPTWTRVMVKRCEKRRTSWVLGCQYVRPPDVNRMMEFG
jgi:hypothetical protein